MILRFRDFGLCLAALAFCLIVGLPVLCGAAAPTPGEQYIDAQLRVVQSLEGKLDAVAGIAEESAVRLLAGGTVYFAGEVGMQSELALRAGGLCGSKMLSIKKKPAAVQQNDVILLSDYGTPGNLEAAVEKLAPTGALVIVFASAEHPVLGKPLATNLRAIPVEVPLDSRLVKLSTGERIIPTAPIALATAEWTFVAELLGACRRQHRQLAIFLSVSLDKDRQRYNRTKGLLFEPDLRPEPVAKGQYGRTFLGIVSASLRAVRAEDVPSIRKAAGLMREATAAHRQVVRTLKGHMAGPEARNDGTSSLFTASSRLIGDDGSAWLREHLHEGDVYLLLGYQDNEDAMARAAHLIRAKTIFITSTAPSPEVAAESRHVYINPRWPLTDACLELAGYDVKACPLSSIMGMTCYYAICAEAARP